MSNSILIDGKTWSCKIHPSCLYSIPCDCSNCLAFSDFLENFKYRKYQDGLVKIDYSHKMSHYRENALEKTTLNYQQ